MSLLFLQSYIAFLKENLSECKGRSYQCWKRPSLRWVKPWGNLGKEAGAHQDSLGSPSFLSECLSIFFLLLNIFLWSYGHWWPLSFRLSPLERLTLDKSNFHSLESPLVHTTPSGLRVQGHSAQNGAGIPSPRMWALPILIRGMSSTQRKKEKRKKI